jgi:TatD DNase family protein
MQNVRTEVDFVDAHCHIDLFPHPEAVVSEVERLRIHTIAVTNAPSVFFATARLCEGLNFAHAALGLHPELVASRGHELKAIPELLKQTRYVGEIGLDYTTSDTSVRAKQRAAFAEILNLCSEVGDKILTVHSRRAASDVISAIGDNFRCRVILHWFSGSRKELDRAVSYGFYFSVGPAMMTSGTGKTLVANIPRHKLLTETDGPFVKLAGVAADPTGIPEVLSALASLWRVDYEETAVTVASNFKTLNE